MANTSGMTPSMALYSKSHNDRLAACWRNQDCGSCINEQHGCGWCPSSGICVPADTLLDPVAKKDICPFEAERFELRTKALGCGCSTTTLLSIIVTVFATIAALALLYGISAALRAVNPFLGTGQAAGWEIELKEDGSREEREWWRRSRWQGWLRSKFQRSDLQDRSEQEVVTERTRLLG